MDKKNQNAKIITQTRYLNFLCFTLHIITQNSFFSPSKYYPSNYTLHTVPYKTI